MTVVFLLGMNFNEHRDKLVGIAGNREKMGELLDGLEETVREQMDDGTNGLAIYPRGIGVCMPFIVLREPDIWTLLNEVVQAVEFILKYLGADQGPCIDMRAKMTVHLFKKFYSAMQEC